MMNGRRSSIEVIADILRMEEASKTHIMYQVGMSYSQLRKYLDYLIERGFLKWTNDGYPGGIYSVTNDGKALLESIEKIEEILYSDSGIILPANGNGSAKKVPGTQETLVRNFYSADKPRIGIKT